jgi:mono/diheme cytochrome c family protein
VVGKQWFVGLVVVGGLVAIGACGGDDDTATSTVASGVVEPSQLPGAPLYAQSCASCHGADLRGTNQGPSHLSIVYEPNHHSDDSFRNAIANGVGAHHWNFGDMAPVPGLSAEQVDAIIAYVRAVQDREGFEPYPPE